MLVRLAFSLLLEVDADILLIDEVLAVGDAAFQQKCADARFAEMKAEGKTIVLVTHEMAAVEEYCHRAMLIDNGRIAHIGDPDEVGRRYLRLNLEGPGRGEPAVHGAGEDASRDDAGRAPVDADGGRASSVEHGGRASDRDRNRGQADFAGLEVGYLLVNDDGVGVATLRALDRRRAAAAAQGRRTDQGGDHGAEPLGAGHYVVHCGINRVPEGGVALDVPAAIDFVVFGGPARPRPGRRCPQRSTTTRRRVSGMSDATRPGAARGPGARRPWAAAASASSTCSG